MDPVHGPPGAPTRPAPPITPLAQAMAVRPPVPSLWLLGKAQSGKTSVVRYLTGAHQAVIGTGFRPETRATFQYAFPAEGHPIVRFFDTRGLGEQQYDPSEDLRELGDSTHAVIVTVRVNDFAIEAVRTPLEMIRQARPSRPVILALTCLHLTYPGHQHPVPDPFERQDLPAGIPEALERCLKEQRRIFGSLVDRIVPIDLTRPEDGFTEPNFGGERLKNALIDLLPAAYGETIRHSEELLAELRAVIDKPALRMSRNYARVAAGLAAVPIPWVDVPAVAALQLRLVTQIARWFDQPPLAAGLVSMLPVISSRILLRQGMRSLSKFIPFLGIPANVAMAYASTLAIGRASAWYYWQRYIGRIPSSGEFQEMLDRQIRLARSEWRGAKAEPE